MDLEPYLTDLEARLDDETEQQLLEAWRQFAAGRFRGDIFSPRRRTKREPGIDWPAVGVNEALDDYDLMALQQLKPCSDAVAAGGGQVLCVRSNYGTPIVPSLFGVELFIMDEKLNTLPTCHPLTGGHDAIKAMVDRGVPDAESGWAGRVFEMGRRFQKIRADYPRIGRYVHVIHPDFQGPMDICEMIWGSSIFYDLVDVPDLVHAFLDLLCETYIRMMRAWIDIVPLGETYAAHWAMMHKGHIMLRDDSAMNLSPAMFDAFIRPREQRCLDAFGGGAIHFCGRGDHFIERASEMPGMHAIAMSQPEYNDMEVIYRHTVDKGIALLGLQRQAAEQALASGRDLHGLVHCS